MGKIYRGESLNMVFRCKRSCGEPMDMAGAEISVLLRDTSGEVVYRFSTRPSGGEKQVSVEGNVVMCRLTKEETAVLSGGYVMEVKVTKGDLTMIDVVKGIKVYDSVIGEEVSV